MARLGRWIDLRMTTKHCTHGLWSLFGKQLVNFIVAIVCYHDDVLTGGCLNSCMIKEWFTVVTRYIIF